MIQAGRIQMIDVFDFFIFFCVRIYTKKRQNSLQNAQMVKKLTDLERKKLEGLLKSMKRQGLHTKKGVS